MSQAPAKQPPPPPAPSGTGLRVVLFGMPDAGKSSLLGALSQAAETQQQNLTGELVDKSGGLGELRKRLYEGQPRSTPQEIAPFPVTFRPDAGGRPVEFLLVDCDGRIATELMNRQRDLLTEARSDRSLAHSVLEADALILVVDVSAGPTQIKRDFNQFARFLRTLEQSRSRRNDINGLPVYLVLSKCDLLAKDDDTLSTWVGRIEERKTKIDEQFREFLAQEAARESQPFGRIDLNLWATAVKRPALGKTPEKPREPYQVAELFRQAFASATAFRRHRVGAYHRLQWTVGGALAVVLGMVLLAVFFLLSQQGVQATQLQNQVEAFFGRQGQKPTPWYTDAADNLIKLKDFREDPAFPHIDGQWQERVLGGSQELKAFADFQARMADLGDKYQSPQAVPNEGQLIDLRQQLQELEPPPGYAADWKRTRPSEQRQEWLADIDVIQQAVAKITGDYQKLIDAAKVVRSAPDLNQSVEEGKKVLAQLEKMPDREKVKDNFVGESRRVRWATVYQFPSVSNLHNDWQLLEEQIEPYLKIARMRRATQ